MESSTGNESQRSSKVYLTNGDISDVDFDKSINISILFHQFHFGICFRIFFLRGGGHIISYEKLLRGVVAVFSTKRIQTCRDAIMACPLKIPSFKFYRPLNKLSLAIKPASIVSYGGNSKESIGKHRRATTG